MSDKEPINDILDLVQPIYDFFDQDLVKTLMWFRIENHLLGGIAPVQMIRLGRKEKLAEIIQVQLDADKAI